MNQDYTRAVAPFNQTTTLYRLRDHTGRLLYVGVATDWPSRMKQHSREKAWWLDVRQTELVTIDGSRAQAEAIEKAVIIAEQPLHNVVHNEGPTLPPLVDSLIKLLMQPQDQRVALTSGRESVTHSEFGQGFVLAAHQDVRAVEFALYGLRFVTADQIVSIK